MKIWIVHQCMKDDWRVTDKLFIKRGCLVLENDLFFSLYLFCWVAKQQVTLKQLRLFPWLDVLIQTSSVLVLFSTLHYRFQYHLSLTRPITIEHVWFKVPENKCAYTPRQSLSIVLTLPQSLVGLMSNQTNLEYIFASIALTLNYSWPDLTSVSTHISYHVCM